MLSTFNNYSKTSHRAKQKLIAFQLGSEFYALPIARVQCILDEFAAHGELGNGRGLIRFQNQSLTLFDLASLFPNQRDTRERPYLLVCYLSEGQLVGIPVPQLPRAIEIAESQMQPIPAMYREAGLPSVVTALIHLDDNREMFFLDLDALPR